MDLGTIGVWSGALRNGERGAILDAAAELEDLGYGTIWFPGGGHEGLADHIMAILGRTKRVIVATGIVSIWTHPAGEIDRVSRSTRRGADAGPSRPAHSGVARTQITAVGARPISRHAPVLRAGRAHAHRPPGSRAGQDRRHRADG